MAAHAAGLGLPSAVVGVEREAFISEVLSAVVPPSYRIGTGVATDRNGEVSTQLDIVIENPRSVSFPMSAASTPRVYLGDTILCVIEVKSNLAGKTDEVEAAVQKLRKLQINHGNLGTFGPERITHIPYFAIGYEGWATYGPFAAWCQRAGVDAALLIDKGYLWQGFDQGFDGNSLPGEWAIYGFVLLLENLMTTVLGAKPPLLRHAR